MELLPDSKAARRAASRCAFATVVMNAAAYALMFGYSLVRDRIAVSFLSSADLALIANMVCTDFIAMPLAWLLLIRTVPKNGEPPVREPLRFGRWMYYLPCVFVLVYGGSILGRLIGAIFGGGLADVVNEAIMPVQPWVTMICAAIVGPIAEELFFRKAMIDRLGGFHPVTAILYSALLFALMHGNLTQFLYAFPIGVLFGCIYYRTQNIGYTVLLHIAVNTFGGPIAQLVSQAGSDVMIDGAKLFNWQEVILMLYAPFLLGMIVLGIVFLTRKSMRTKYLSVSSDHPRYTKTFFLNAGWFTACITFLGLFIFSEFIY